VGGYDLKPNRNSIAQIGMLEASSFAVNHINISMMYALNRFVMNNSG
jgi:hypothetical protein